MVAGVEFHRYEKLSYFDSAGIELRLRDWIVTRTARGFQLAQVAEIRPPQQSEQPFPALERLATSEDHQRQYRNRLRASEALILARQKVSEHGLEMQILDAEVTLDGDRLVYYFYAEARVDFRLLLKDLAGAFHRRIELYQINARDRAKQVGGIGPCGRTCCCVSWLREFTPVSVKLAKEQGASLNPQKISGSCGRLMCCLRYEYETYLAMRKELPAIGSLVKIPEGEARVVDVHPLRKTLLVALQGQEPFEIPLGRAVDKSGESCRSCSAPRCADES